ncbi:hypothetical protein GH714_034811 [Hevea brasiliensis]|uniref:Protein kinase domain-containing protein n=1 Tax=Hevea brasiliensis TaxID=3981 RepID=A0A6A6NAZ4_HEVBR|nr:hypothetical protein GH714_034811 [Hevea brasiliensis]
MSAEGQKFNQIYNLSFSDCQAKCLNNCSCAVYAYASGNQTVCEIWGQRIAFTKKYDETRVIYVLRGKKAKRWIWPVITFPGLGAVLMACSVYYFIQRRNRMAAENDAEQEILPCELEANATDSGGTGKLTEVKRDWKKSNELHFFSFESIVSATNNFAAANKLGEGGLGLVFKGELNDGQQQQVAVKRLPRNSGQGLAEFKNELLLISKLQHTNLVRLVGCCIQREEKILIDLKASNILLDAEMNPKILDFGMAKIFGRNESEAKTTRVVGTHGYMAPEYALRGTVSIKIDAWELWSEGRGLQLMDPTLEESCSYSEVLRCIHVGLLRVQDQATDRPTTSDIVSMLTNETLNLPAPRQPAFFFNRFEEEPGVPKNS